VSAPGSLRWWEAGEAFFATARDRLTEAELDRPSLLPGWPRRTVIAHVARNADALVNLLSWACTGEETPMYASPEARATAITDTAALPAHELFADCRAASQRLAATIGRLPETAWTAMVRTAQGRMVTAGEVPWMRCREVWVHAVDLDAGTGFADLPDDLLAALIDDVIESWYRRGAAPELALAAGEHRWGSGPMTVTGGLADLAAWVTGRSTGADRLQLDGSPPVLPAWL
jgi:maleylpyruvate isomerase